MKPVRRVLWDRHKRSLEAAFFSAQRCMYLSEQKEALWRQIDEVEDLLWNQLDELTDFTLGGRRAA